MVLAISFIEAPLKFRAPGVTLQVGLGIGRLVFRALNGVELLLAAGTVAAFIGRPPSVSGAMVAAAVAVTALLVQVLLVRPHLTKRSDTVLAGEEGPRSRAHFVYIGFELVKVAALLIAGVMLLAA
ncbi:hypothetical protein [Mycobacterium sp. ITM-2016-00318]|uniref:hypothetical protein n=1 Tax=Mycobacterium sp. ITM-2016-00318 TaxID=2099693 RepID=UPI0037C60322